MRMIKYNFAPYVQSLAVAIEKDPASMENWRCLHIVAHYDDVSYSWFEVMLESLKENHKEIDCDILHCSDNDMFLVTRSMPHAELVEIASELIQSTSSSTGSAVDFTIYDLFQDWHTIRDILLSKTKDSGAKTVALPVTGHQFGEVESLSEVFAEAKKSRGARLPMHVLMVEDDALTRRLVSNSLKEKYALITATNAEEAVANYLLHAPDIVFLDIGLPDANGFDVLQRILTCDPEAYVVMFSANSYLDNVTAALANGAAGFIAKPFKKEKMLHYIESSADHHRKCA